MSSVGWYWHRLRVMGTGELAAHGRRKVYQVSDSLLSRRRFASSRPVPEGSRFPVLAGAAAAPELLQSTLGRDVTDILEGRWMAFGYLPLQVENPPRWHKDYLAGVDLATSKPALKLHHRLQGKADIKLIWEPSRWYSLVRLAQAAYVLNDQTAAERCVGLLEDWLQKNPPYVGWNWVSALESGLRLIQFAWIDALLSGAAASRRSVEGQSPGAPPRLADSRIDERWARVRTAILPAHCWFTWRDRSFGSSANNHLIGELAGLIVALVRWPTLKCWAAPIEHLQRLWEAEVLRQFAPDGGNREQALNYQLFSWEFCWQARLALESSGRAISPEVEDRLRAAAAFFTSVQVEANAWDYGDSDSAFVTPLFTDWAHATTEWHRWLTKPGGSPAIGYWLGEPPKPFRAPGILRVAEDWQFYPESGFAVCQRGLWFLRWDLSPLGYLSTAGHGHCDALHLSIWYDGQPIVIDPGTGAYHADRPVRDYLASWEAHNGPHPIPAQFPERRGTFLWSDQHPKPRWQEGAEQSLKGELSLPTGVMRRTIKPLREENGWQLDDGFYAAEPAAHTETQVLWQLAPGAKLAQLSPTEFRIEAGAAAVILQVDAAWCVVGHGQHAPEPAQPERSDALYGSCSPAFRRIEQAPFILVRGQAQAPHGLRTIFRSP